jgi:putative transposase
MDERYLFSAVRYVENNPVRAGLRSVAEEWRWSSAGAHLHGSDDELVTVSPMLELVCDWKSYLQVDTDASVSEEIHGHLRTGRPLGSERFLERLEQQLQRILRRGKPGPKPKQRDSNERNMFLDESGR